MPDRSFFEAYYRALSAADFDAIAQCFDPDVALTHAGETIRGRESLIASIKEARAVVKNDVIPEDMILTADRAAVVFTDRFEALVDELDFMGRRLSRGDRFEKRICGFYKFAGGRIKEVEMFAAGA